MKTVLAALALSFAAGGAVAAEKATKTDDARPVAAAPAGEETGTARDASRNSDRGFLGLGAIFDADNRGYSETQWRGNWRAGRKFAPSGGGD
ncbi:MAG: hypothetical protein AAF371_12155 [Pseudomonadota bacterium]